MHKLSGIRKPYPWRHTVPLLFKIDLTHHIVESSPPYPPAMSWVYTGFWTSVYTRRCTTSHSLGIPPDIHHRRWKKVKLLPSCRLIASRNEGIQKLCSIYTKSQRPPSSNNTFLSIHHKLKIYVNCSICQYKNVLLFILKPKTVLL